MAVQVHKPTETPQQAMDRFASDLLKDIEASFATQQIWPNEIYPGYAQVNALRYSRGQWHSTGAGAKSFSTQTQVSPSGKSIILRYNDYLRFVDMGVGKHTKWQDVRAEQNARFNRRYISVWDRRHGESHRPAILSRSHRVASRMMKYFEDYFAEEGYYIVLKSFEGLTPVSLFT